jgi:hypothetical protein
MYVKRGCLGYYQPFSSDAGVWNGKKGGRTSFWFANIWLQAKGFVEQVKRWWDSYYFEGNLSYVLAET